MYNNLNLLHLQQISGHQDVFLQNKFCIIIHVVIKASEHFKKVCFFIAAGKKMFSLSLLLKTKTDFITFCFSCCIHFGFNNHQTRATILLFYPKLRWQVSKSIWFWIKNRKQTHVKINVWSENETCSMHSTHNGITRHVFVVLSNELFCTNLLLIFLCKWQIMHVCVKVKTSQETFSFKYVQLSLYGQFCYTEIFWFFSHKSSFFFLFS